MTRAIQCLSRTLAVVVAIHCCGGIPGLRRPCPRLGRAAAGSAGNGRRDAVALGCRVQCRGGRPCVDRFAAWT